MADTNLASDFWVVSKVTQSKGKALVKAINACLTEQESKVIGGE
jgi:hypothetical protein